MIKSLIQNIEYLVKLISPEAWIALFSFLIAFITLWVTLISPARISVRIGNTIAVYFSKLTKNEEVRDLLSICLPLDMLNEGAKSGLIENVALKVKFGDNQQKYLYKVSREIAEIQVYTNKGQIDVAKMQGNLRDPFTSITLLGKSISHKNYIFWTANEEELSVDIPTPFKIYIELFLQIKNKWRRQGKTSFTNQTIKIKEKTGWALLESDKSLELSGKF